VASENGRRYDQFMRIVLAIALFAFSACDRAWNAANQRQLKLDVAAVVKRDVDCSMIGTTRDAICRDTMTAREATALARSLRLAPLSHGDARLSHVRQLPEWPRAATLLYGDFSRPPQLRTPAGVQLEFLVLAWSPSGNRVTLLTSYASG
jgi:hypothetical protein